MVGSSCSRTGGGRGDRKRIREEEEELGGVRRRRRHSAVFFDSLGRDGPWKYDIAIPMITGTERLVYNCKRIQSDDSKDCGLYCLYVLHWLVTGVDLKSIMSVFDNNDHERVKNDEIVKEFGKCLKRGLFAH